jgi:hypothetical protein
MPAVLTGASSLRCIHGGTVTMTPSQRFLTVAGDPALVQADIATAVVAGCPNTNASAGQKPCVKLTTLLAGTSTTLRVAGQPVLLASARGLTDGVPPAPVMWQVATAGQTLLEAR